MASTSAENGSHVSWRELNLLVGPIHDKLDTLTKGMDLLLAERWERQGATAANSGASAARRQWTASRVAVASLAATLLAAVGGVGYLIAYVVAGSHG